MHLGLISLTAHYADVIPAVWHHRRGEMAAVGSQGDCDSWSAEKQSKLQPFLSTHDCGIRCAISPALILLGHSLWLLCQGQVCVDQPENYIQ